MSDNLDKLAVRVIELCANGHFCEALPLAESIEPLLRVRARIRLKAPVAADVIAGALPRLRERAAAERRAEETRLRREFLRFVRLGQYTEAVEVADRLLPILRADGNERDAAGLERELPWMRAHRAWEHRNKFRIVGADAPERKS